MLTQNLQLIGFVLCSVSIGDHFGATVGLVLQDGRQRNSHPIELINIYIQPTPVNATHYSVNNSWFWCRVSSVVHKRFVSKLSICRPNLYWPMLLVSYYGFLKETNFRIALTMHLPSWRTGLKQINIQNVTICVTSNTIYLY